MNDEKNMPRKVMTRTDVLLVIILLAVGAAFWFWRKQAGSGTMVKVYSDNEIIADFPLDRDTTFVISNELGNNTLVIENGFVYITDADCPDKICEQIGTISKPGDTIVCLPHKLVVEISDEH